MRGSTVFDSSSTRLGPSQLQLPLKLLVRSMFRHQQARRDRPTPCPPLAGVGMKASSIVLVDAKTRSNFLVCNASVYLVVNRV